MKIQFNNFKKEYLSIKKDVNAAMIRVASSGWYILGKEVESFEKAFAKFTGVKYVVGVANGLEALEIALLSLGVKAGDEVITTSLSAVATALAIESVGAKPVFADIDEFYHLDPREIEKKITKKTKAIIPVHLYGQSAEMDKIMSLGRKYKIPVIEDCAQSHGAKYGSQMTGSMGRIGCFSFYPTKNLGALGDAGAITTNDAKLSEICRMIRNYGQKNRYEHPIFGINSRLDEMQAAILKVKLKKLALSNSRRNRIAKIYRKELAAIKDVVLPRERRGASHVYHLFVIEARDRNELGKALLEKGIPTLVHYPIPIHKQKSFSQYNSKSLPQTEKKAETILSLPCHPYMTKEGVLYICRNIKLFYKGRA